MGVTGSVQRWDQRAVALVRLKGTSADFELFEAEVRGRDWRLLNRCESPAPALHGEGHCHYTVEVRFLGSAIRASTAAREHLEVVSDRLVLDLVVEAVQCVERDPVDLPVWYAYDPLPSGAAPTGSRTERWRARTLAWSALTLGSRDTGRQVRAGSEADALALAARSLPGVAPAPAAVAVRRSMNVEPPPPPGAWPLRRRPMRRLAMMRFPALVGLVCGAWVAGLWGAGPLWSVVPPLPFLLAAVAAAFMIARWAMPEVSGAQLVAAGFAGPLLAAAFGAFAVVTAPDKRVGFGVVVVGIALGYLVLTGVWLWVRQSRWGLTLPWLLPALLAFLPGLLPGLGLSLPALYLDAFGIDLEDVDVPAAMRLLATLKLLAASLIWLMAPAILGYLRHTHRMITGSWVGYSAVAFVSVYALMAGVLGLAIMSASAAGKSAVAAAAAGRTPGHYYGIKPEWFCVHPVRDVAQVPTDGGTLDPVRPYLSLGDAGGTAVLWDPREKAALKVPLSALRLVPADAPRQPCA
ncbi:hypothetical protein J7E97_16415 [Streptomyces sp. ISL-66]|uniref:hypothetical protein n=1 Tax=Streptomyces sp. ISL-66 TaxID=2819186 RepID=UPI001BEB76E8|nr:hypothetical protein [Streptomyces sp. ISL-66]MBT2469416.1 hypothetical protein [Streptomyces sp. ISL-66]